MGSPFDFRTYVVLDVPPPTADIVESIRERYDIVTASLPVEITVAGSSGIGTIDPRQDPDDAYRILDSIATATPPITASFGPVHRFPGTDIFVLTLEPEDPFLAPHDRIRDSGILFGANPFPYKPHCTIRAGLPVDDAKAEELLAVSVPGSFVLDALSVYTLRRIPPALQHRTRLQGRATRPLQ